MTSAAVAVDMITTSMTMMNTSTNIITMITMTNAAVDMIITITTIMTSAAAGMIITMSMKNMSTIIMQPVRKSKFSFWRIWAVPTVLPRWNAVLMN